MKVFKIGKDLIKEAFEITFQFVKDYPAVSGTFVGAAIAKTYCRLNGKTDGDLMFSLASVVLMAFICYDIWKKSQIETRDGTKRVKNVR